MTYGAIIIGGGFYGLRIALYLHEHLHVKNILILEKESEMMTRASYTNQARIHNGYHYPRSVLTALRSRVNFPIFVEEYQDAVVNDFDKYYAVAKNFSKVSARQFDLFCKRIGADIEPAQPDMKKMFNKLLIDDVFKVKEYAFDTHKLRKLLMHRVEGTEISFHNDEEVISLKESRGQLSVTTTKDTYQAEKVFNCGYSQINKLHTQLGLPLVPLKHEITEMCLIKLPKDLTDFSVTIMDGPFFSIMPFPNRGLHTLSHVRYTPHTEWYDKEGAYRDGHQYLDSLELKSNYPQMYADVVRFIPTLKNIQWCDSLWEVKTVLAKSEGDDSRPILFSPDHGIANYTCIMGGKLDNIYDAFEELNLLYAD